jgi:hypothetical protein
MYAYAHAHDDRYLHTHGCRQGGSDEPPMADEPPKADRRTPYGPEILLY